MKRRVLTWSVLLASLALLVIGIQGSFANQDGKTSRYKTVEIETTQYNWELVSNRDGHIVCQVTVDHPNRPSYDETIQICADKIFPQGPTPTPIVTLATTPVPAGTPATPVPGRTPTLVEPFDLAGFFQSVYWRFVDTRELKRTIKIPLPEIIINITVPPNQQAPFHVILSAYEPVYGQKITGISGVLNGLDFTCATSRCNVPIKTDSILEFWASSSFGDESKHVQAALRVVTTEKGATLELQSLVPVTIFRDSCADAWNMPVYKIPTWASLPASPDDLNTMKPYQYLAGKLISVGLVNAQECPGGGLAGNGGPNTCGLEKAAPAVIEWQNQYDVNIWESGRSLGVPPRLIKTLLEQESQFWPANSQRELFEYGLAQINQTGADVALRWDNDLFNTICSGLIFDCSKVYGRLPTWLQATLRGGLVRAIDAQCPTCQYGIDMSRAYDSVPVFTRTIRSNCLQVKYILNTRAKEIPPVYEDMMRFTLVSYHSGYRCLTEGLDYTLLANEPLDWDHVSTHMLCPGAREYVDNFWKSLLEFDKFRLKQPESALNIGSPTFFVAPVPTNTPPPPTPTPILALSHIRVQVYVDSNNNNYPDPGERVDGAKVTVTLPNGQILTSTTVNGESVIDMTGQPVDEEVIVALPELYRQVKVRVMRDGEIPVVFRLEQPVVPPALP